MCAIKHKHQEIMSPFQFVRPFILSPVADISLSNYLLNASPAFCFGFVCGTIGKGSLQEMLNCVWSTGVIPTKIKSPAAHFGSPNQINKNKTKLSNGARLRQVCVPNKQNKPIYQIKHVTCFCDRSG